MGDNGGYSSSETVLEYDGLFVCFKGRVGVMCVRARLGAAVEMWSLRIYREPRPSTIMDVAIFFDDPQSDR